MRTHRQRQRDDMGYEPATTLQIKLDPQLKRHFLRVCQDRDTTASREVRQMIRLWLAEHQQQEMSL